MAGQTPQSEQVYSVYTEGQKAGLTPHLGFDPAIGSPCKRGKCCNIERSQCVQFVGMRFDVVW